MRGPLRLSILLVCCIVILVTPSGAGAGSAAANAKYAGQYVFAFEKIVDTDTLLPGGSQRFSAFGAPSLSDGEIAFVGRAVGSQRIYVYDLDDGTLRDLAEGDLPSISLGNAAFRGPLGITVIDGGVRQVAELGVTLVPGTSRTFDSATTPSIEKDDVAFDGSSSSASSSVRGIYAEIGGRLRMIADTETTIPGTGYAFDAFAGPAIDGGLVAFKGEARGPDGFPVAAGIYLGSGGSLGVVADRTTTIPGRPGASVSFDGFVADPALDGQDVAFVGSHFGPRSEGGVRGVYALIGGVLHRIADSDTPIPDGVGTFPTEGFAQVALDSGVVVFHGRGAAEGLYTNLGGQLARVIDKQDVLDGKAISRFQFTSDEGLELAPGSVEDSVVAFQVYFADQSQGIYVGRPMSLLVIDIDVKPRSRRNPINPFGRGKIAVALLGSNAFDVVDVDGSTVVFGPDHAAPLHGPAGHPGDVNGDGYTDLVYHFATPDTGIAAGDDEACIGGAMLDGTPFAGCDAITTPGACGLGFELALLLPAWMLARRARRRIR